MQQLLKEITNDIDWRMSEITNLKVIPAKYNLSEPHQKALLMCSIPSLYALWEGFIKNSFESLVNHLNSLSLDHTTIHINILTHNIENGFQLGNKRANFKSKKKMVVGLQNEFSSSFAVKKGIPTESNLNFDATNKILERFNISPLSNIYRSQLSKLLMFRNKISHGENSIRVSIKIFNEFASLIQILMHEIILKFENYLYDESYKQ